MAVAQLQEVFSLWNATVSDINWPLGQMSVCVCAQSVEDLDIWLSAADPQRELTKIIVLFRWYKRRDSPIV